MGLEPETEKQIISSYKGYAYTEALWSEVVGGVEIKYNNGNRIYAYKDGGIYTLGEAYDKGILNRENLINITSFQEQYYPFLHTE